MEIKLKKQMFRYFLLMSFLIMTSCSSKCEFDFMPKSFKGSNAHLAHAGKAYMQAIEAAKDSKYLARELTDEEIDNAENHKGCGYSESKRTGEEAPLYAIEKIIEQEDHIIIIEDDGRIEIIET